MSSCFLFFLLCLSLHACTARRLAAVDHDHNNNKLESIKNDMKNGFNKNSDAVVQAKSSSSSIKEERIDQKSHDADDDTQKLEDANKTIGNKKEKTSGAVKLANKSVASSVSLRVPHRKHGEKHPGFNLDYSPPKTHPPSHN